MEAPIPTSLTNPITFKDKEGKEFIIELLSKKEDLILKINEKNDFLGGYKTIKKLEDFQKLSNLFRIFDKIEEIKEYLLSLIKEKKVEISQKNDIIIFSLELSMANKTKKASLELEKEEIDLQNSFILMSKKIKDMEKEIEELRDFKLSIVGSPAFHMSRVVKKESELNFVKETIKENLNLNKTIEVIKFIPLFSTSREGDSASQFHSKCNGKSNSLVLVKTKTGKRFGGFTSLHWSYASNNYANDSKAFVFSLDNKECYKYNNNGNAIYCHSSYGPTFGGGLDLCLSNGCLNNNDSYTNQSSFDYKGKNYALNGSSNFRPEVYEVYQVKV
jgi:hypothetical protein